MANSVRVTYYGMEGEGRTVKEAREDAGRKVERALSGDYTPVILRLGNIMFLVHRSPQYGWCYTPHIEDKEGALFTTMQEASKEEAIRRAKVHMAHNAIGTLPEDEILAYVDKKDRSEMKRYYDWQMCCRAWMATGADSETCRNHADRLEWPETAAIATA